MYGLRYRGEYTNAIAQELDAMLSAIKAWLTVDHNEDGSHNLRPSGFDFVPIGASMLWFESTAPERWIFAQGQAVSRTTYAALFQKWGTTYGVGDGTNTFNVPNLQQRFPIGYQTSGSVLGTAGGTFDHTHNVSSHTHSFTATSDNNGGHDHGASTGAGGDHAHGGSTGNAGSHSHSQGAHNHAISSVAGAMAGSDVGVRDNVTQVDIFNDSGTSTNGDHSHSIGGSGDHSHSISAVGNHTHGIAGTTGSSTAASDGANPPYLVVNFIVLAGI